MSLPLNTVSIHPYFKVHPGKLDAVKAHLRSFVSATSSESTCLYYEFTINGDEIFCREGYIGAEGVLTHLANVDAQLKEMLTLSDLTRLELHGPAADLAKLKEPMAGLPVAWFEYEVGVVN
jgi:quinol monooxygenase YgiN